MTHFVELGEERLHIGAMLCVEFLSDFVHFGSAPVLDALIENDICHLHGRHQTVYVFERHGDIFLIF